MEGARVPDLRSVRPSPVLPVVWVLAPGREEQGHARRDGSPGRSTLQEGRGSRCDSADTRGASAALPSPLRWPLLPARGTRHPVPYARSGIRAPEPETPSSVGAKETSDCSGSGLEKTFTYKIPKGFLSF